MSPAEPVRGTSRGNVALQHLKSKQAKVNWLLEVAVNTTLAWPERQKWVFWEPGIRMWNHAPTLQELWAISPFTLKSQCMYLWNLVAMTSISMLFYNLPSQEHNMKMYKVTRGHAGGSRWTQTSTQLFSHMCWGHDARETSVKKSENTFNKETNPIKSNAAFLLKPPF